MMTLKETVVCTEEESRKNCGDWDRLDLLGEGKWENEGPKEPINVTYVNYFLM